MSDPAPAAPADTTPPAEAPPAGGEPTPVETEPSGPARGPDGKFQGKEPGTFDELEGTYDELLAGEGETVTVPRAHLEKMRGEHKAYRERWKPVEQSLGALHPDDREDFLKVAAAVASGDVEQHSRAAQWMRAVADQLSPAEKAKVAEAMQQEAAGAPGQQADEFDPFDPEQIDARVRAEAEKLVDEKLSAREQKQQVDEATARIVGTAKELGYNTDPRDPMYGLLLLTARERHGGDLRKAHEAIEADLNTRATTILESKRADAQTPTAPRTGQAPAGQRKATGSLRDVESAARERLNKILDGPAG